MKSKKRPLNFAAPSFAEEAPPPAMGEEALALGMPPVPTEADKPAAAQQGMAQQDMAQQAAAQTAAQTVAQAAVRPQSAKQGGRFIYFLALAATVLWVGGLTAYTLGFAPMSARSRTRRSAS